MINKSACLSPIYRWLLNCQVQSLQLLIVVIQLIYERVGYEMIDSQEAHSVKLAIIISYPTSVSGIIVLLKTINKIMLIVATVLDS